MLEGPKVLWKKFIIFFVKNLLDNNNQNNIIEYDFNENETTPND